MVRGEGGEAKAGQGAAEEGSGETGVTKEVVEQCVPHEGLVPLLE